MKYELTQTNVKDLIEWLRGGHVNRAVKALENLKPVADKLMEEQTQVDSEYQRMTSNGQAHYIKEQT